MKIIQTIPVYNLKSQKLTSVTQVDFKAINEELIDHRFFEVQGQFIIIKNKFFKPEHLVRHHKFFIQGQEIVQHVPANAKYKKVLFILESPHKHEYDYEHGFKAGLPLAGSFDTFLNTFSLLMQRITQNEDEIYEVTVYNPVPFQTSMHYLFRKTINERTRFNFWLHGWWNMRYHKEFEHFLTRNRFDYYINASTKAYKSLISFKLSSNVNTEYQVYHPGSGFWNRKELKFGIKKIVHLDDSHYMFQLPEEKEASIF